MGWRRIEQGIENQTLEILPAICPVCHKSLYRNVTFLTGGWARCSACNEVVHYSCLSGGRFLKDRPRFCVDCKAGRVRAGQTMPAPNPGSSITPPENSDASASSATTPSPSIT